MASSNWFTLNNGIYPVEYIFSLNQTDDEFIVAFRSCWSEDLTDDQILNNVKSDYEAVTYLFFKCNICVIRFRKRRPCYQHVAHEIFHATFITMHRIGVKLTKSSDESYAYLNGYLIKYFYENL